MGVALAATAGLSSHPVSADTRESLDISIGASASNNPYLDRTNSGWRAAGSVAVDPQIWVGDEVTSAVFTGELRLREYTSQYPRDETISVGAAAQTRISARAVLSGGVNLMSSRSGVFDVLQIAPSPPADPSAPLMPQVVPPDISALGRAARLTRYSVHAGLDDVLSQTSQISFDVSGGYTDSQSSTGQNYTHVDLAVDYTRVLNPRTSLLASMRVGGADYRAAVFRDADYAAPLIGIKSNLSEDITLIMQGGATLTHFVGGGDHVDAAANASICRMSLHATLCAVLARRSTPTAYDGVSTSDTAGLSYSLQPGPADRLTFGANFGRTRGLDAPAVSQRRSTTVYGISGDYAHQLSTRTFAFVRPSVTYDRSSAIGNSRTRSSLQLEIGIRQHFGYLQ